MLSLKNILNGLGRAVCGGKPHNVPKALQSVNTKNTSEERRGGGGWGGVHALKCRHVANMSHFAISAPDTSARMNDVGQLLRRRCFCSEEPSGTAHVCSKIRIGFKLARGRRRFPPPGRAFVTPRTVPLASAAAADGERGSATVF